MSQNQPYQFLTDEVDYQEIETKSGKKYYVSGYISNGEVDLVNDLVTEDCMKSMLSQLKSRTITLDYEHEVWRNDPSILPVGKVVDARIDNKGLWVKAELNKNSPKFKNMWGSVKDGMVTAFSIAYKALSVAHKNINGAKVRLLNDLNILNVALTGTPVNRSAVIENYGMKAVMLKSIEDLETKNEVGNMPDEETKPDPSPAEEKKDTTAEAPAEEKKEEAKPEEAKPEEKPAETPAETKSEVDLKSILKRVDNLEKENAELKSKLEKGVFKSPESTPAPEMKSEDMPDILSVIC